MNDTGSNGSINSDWLTVSAISTIKPYANIPQDDRDAADKEMAKLFETLLGQSCLEQTKNAIRYEGTAAFAESFKLLGQVAGQEIFSSAEVNAGTENFTKFLNVKGLQQKLGIKKQ